MRTDPAEILEAAADLYESEKIDWCTGTFFNGRRMLGVNDAFSPIILSACAWGALIHAATENEALSFKMVSGIPATTLGPMKKGIQVALDAVQGKLGGAHLPDFNDHVVKDKQQIIDLFKETAKDLRNRA